MQRDLPWELDSALRTLGRSSLGETLGRSAGTPANFGSHCRVTVEADGSRRLIGSSFQEGPLSGELIFMEYDEDMSADAPDVRRTAGMQIYLLFYPFGGMSAELCLSLCCSKQSIALNFITDLNNVCGAI